MCIDLHFFLQIVGVSFHVGSGCGEPEVFSRAIDHAAQLFALGETLGYRMNLLDIGGGYPGGSDSSIDEVNILYKNSFFHMNYFKILSLFADFESGNERFG